MIVFNPFTGKLDFTGTGTSSTVSKKEIIKAILVESNETLTYPIAAILFDSDSILYNDDEEL